VLSSATTDSGDRLVATNLGLWVMGPGRDAVRHYWDEIDRATWAEGVLTVERLVGDRSRLVHRLPKPGRLPELVRDRVTSSIVVSERSAVPGGHVRVVARRRPGVDRLRWGLLYDPGELAADPAARSAAQEILARHRSHVGAGGEEGPVQRRENESGSG
jgi:hypothetical protein